MRIHSNDRPYACHFCAKRFTQKSHVDQHERIHTGNLLWNRFFSKDDSGISWVVSGSKPFSCQFCGRAFRQRSQQLGHEATHSNLLSTTSQVAATQPNQHLQLPGSTSQPQPQHNHQPQQEMLRNEVRICRFLQFLIELTPHRNVESSHDYNCMAEKGGNIDTSVEKSFLIHIQISSS